MSGARFQATVRSDGGPGAFVEVPAGAVRALGGSARPPVRATVDGHPYLGRIAVYGGRSYLGLRKDLLAAAGLEVGDRVEVSLELDAERLPGGSPGSD